jgi:hypothetical protein
MNSQREAAHQIAMPEPRESLGDLLGDLMTQSTELVKGEVALAKAELRDKARLYSSAALIIARFQEPLFLIEYSVGFESAPKEVVHERNRIGKNRGYPVQRARCLA